MTWMTFPQPYQRIEPGNAVNLWRSRFDYGSDLLNALWDSEGRCVCLWGVVGGHKGQRGNVR